MYARLRLQFCVASCLCFKLPAFFTCGPSAKLMFHNIMCEGSGILSGSTTHMSTGPEPHVHTTLSEQSKQRRCNGFAFSAHRQPWLLNMDLGDYSNGYSRKEFVKRAVTGTAAAAFALVGAGQPKAAEAFCGEMYPRWAYYVDFDEVFVPFSFEGYSGKLFARTVGNKKEQQKVKTSRWMRRYSVP